MKVTAEQLPESRVQLIIEADEEATRQAEEKAYRQLSGRVNIPGFRRGKAPRNLVERVLGRDYILREAAQLLLPDLYQQALQETDTDPIYDPDIDIISLEPLSVKVIVAVRPTAELPDYRNIRLPKEEVTVTDEQVESSLDNLREQHAEWRPVERPVQEGDTAVIDASATAEDGEKILEQENIEYLVEPERNVPLAGFAEQLVGMAAGEEKSFSLTFPEDYRQQELAGKKAGFQVKLHSVKEKHTPELDDDFAKTVGDYETLAALRDGLRGQLLMRLSDAANRSYEDTVLMTVVDQAKVDVPPAMVEEQTETSLHSLEDRLQAQGASMPEYLAALRQTRLQLLEGLRQEARQALRQQVVLNEVAKRENVEIADADIDAEIESSVSFLGQRAEEARQQLMSEESRRSIAFRLRQRQARQRLAEIASQPVGEDEGRGETASEASNEAAAE
ncbi:MAG: trigger factor [Chloroflexi bacterium]|nr:trigger factor [Chloroflexota bacterium]MCL5107340.1 trigger factor [Chloroflexota bacterium]